MSKQRFEVQRHLDQVYVARQNGGLPQPRPGEVLLRMVACGICGADIRVVTRNKATPDEPERSITLGHEGVGRLLTCSGNAPHQHMDEYAVVLPHVHHRQHVVSCSAPCITPTCIGNGHTLHMGWDIDGCFADLAVVPAANVVRIARRHLLLAACQAPGLREAIFALVEPMLCTLSAYELLNMHLQRDLPPRRGLVIGCGPIGLLHSLVLLARGFEIWLTDTVQKRAELAQWCLDYQGHLFDPAKAGRMFDLAMVTASDLTAIRTGEMFVRHEGIVYLFAGLNAADRAAMDRDNVFFYEPVHRKALHLRTTLRLAYQNTCIVLSGTQRVLCLPCPTGNRDGGTQRPLPGSSGDRHHCESCQSAHRLTASRRRRLDKRRWVTCHCRSPERDGFARKALQAACPAQCWRSLPSLCIPEDHCQQATPLAALWVKPTLTRTRVGEL